MRQASSDSTNSNSGISLRGKVDLGWLRGQVEQILEKNRVTEERNWNGYYQICTFHAPFLNPKIDYPPWLPSWLKQVWRMWWYFRLPWQVSYPHQWFWDSCGHAIVLSHIDLKLAEAEIESLLYAQRGDGFIPHMVWNRRRMQWVDRLLQILYPSRHTSPYIQPPALAEAVEHIYKESGDMEFVVGVLPRLKKYYLYLSKERSRGEDGLLEIISSYESGKDRSSEYDLVYGESNAKPVLQGPMFKLGRSHWKCGWNVDKILAANRFRVKDLLVNCIYANNLSTLSCLCQVAKDKEGEEFSREKALKVEGSILTKMYDNETGLFYSLDARYGEDKLIKVSTVSSLLTLVLDNISQSQVERLVKNHLGNPEEFWLRYPVPAEPLNSGRAEVKGHIIWRGLQTWIYPNWYIFQGLRKQAQRFPQHRQEYEMMANEIVWRSYELIQKEGFCDFYHSQTGKGGAASEFSLSTLILDMVYDLR